MNIIDLNSKIGIGTAQFGMNYGISNEKGQTSRVEVSQILEVARNSKVNLIDTAIAYGNAEKILGSNDLKGFDIVSKFLPFEVEESLRKQLHQTLHDLNVSSIYGYLAHSPLQLVKQKNQWEQLQSLKEEKLINKIGYSLNSPVELMQLLEAGLIPDIVQVPYSYFDTRFEEKIKELKKGGCEVHTRSAFLQGLFFMEPNELGEFFNDVKPSLQKIQMHKKLAGSLLHFVLNKPFIDKVIIGVEDKKQLEKNLNDIKNPKSLPVLDIRIPDQILMPNNWPND